LIGGFQTVNLNYHYFKDEIIVSGKSEKFIDVAYALVNAAREKGYLAGAVTVIEDLAEPEKALFVRIAAAVMQYAENKPSGELSQDDILSLFIFVYAKAGETVFKWRHGDKKFADVPLDGIFAGQSPMSADEKMLAYFSKLKLAEDMAIAFSAWNEDNPDYCEGNSVHPLLPLLEALKWNWRIAVDIAAKHLSIQ
jgi:hypothetical protein